MTNSIENMKERFNNLPIDAQRAIQMFDYDKALKNIHTEYKLHLDQASSLETIVANIVFGDEKSHVLVELIEAELRVPYETAVKISLDVNKKILVPIQKNMQALQLGNDGV